MYLRYSSFLLVLLFSAFSTLNASADKAIPLITVKGNAENGEDEFILNPEAISLIENLPSQIKIIAAIGDARVGKSTALNFIHYTLSNVGNSAFHTKNNVEEIFKTGNTMSAVTRGVWISTVNIPGKPEMDNVILLDVEGTDLGNDAVTDKLSIFTALTSSTLMLFMKESPSTHILDFLYKIVRLSEVAFGKRKSEYFPHLTAVLRGALETPQEYKNIDEYIIDALITSKWKDESDDKRDAIGSRFPKDHITVFNLPYDASISKLLENPKRLAGSEYLRSIEILTQHIFQLPEKKSLEGVVLDGQTLAMLTKKLVNIMNNKTLWNDLNPNFYSLFEEDLCRRSYEKHIEPLLRVTKHTAQYMEDQKDEKLKLFKEDCKLPKCFMRAEMNIKNAIKHRKDYEEQDNILDTAIWVVGVVAAGALFIAGYLYSDVQLKDNTTVLNNSEYETIGLRGVEWVWNQDAERLGLSGKGSGVVAQEVELLYPWLVTEGYDGYKRVNYLALRVLMWAKKFQRKAEDLNII